MRRDAPIFFVTAVPGSRTSEGTRLDRINERILSLSYEDSERKADKLKLTLDNYDLAMYDEPAFKKGLLLDVRWGYVGNMVPARRCVVQKLTGGLIVTVECLAESILMNKIVHSRSHVNVRRSDVVRTLARAHGFSDATMQVQDTTTVFPEIAQARLTDAQLIKRLADLEGFEFYVDHEGFHWHERRLDQPVHRVLRWFTDRTGEIKDFSVENDITAKKGRRRTAGRDPLERTDISGDASDDTDRDAISLGSTIEIPNPENQSWISREATEADVRAASEDLTPTSAQTGEEAEGEARAAFRQGKLVAIKLKLMIVGDSTMQAKQVVRVEGLGQRLSGLYYVSKVNHDVSSGFAQTLEVVSDSSGGYSRRSALGDLELPTRGLQTQGNSRASSDQVHNDVQTAVDAGALREEQIPDPEHRGRFITVYRSPGSGNVVAHRTQNGRYVAEED